MSSGRIPLREPFDIALTEFYKSNARWPLYKRLIEIGVELGDPLAQYAMATWYLHGHSQIGVRRDLRRAVELLEECAPFLNRASYDLAVCKIRGAGTRRDLKGAFRLFSRAANSGSLAAIETQADCLRAGIGTPKDVEAANSLLRRAKKWRQQLERLEVPLYSSYHRKTNTRRRIAVAKRSNQSRRSRSKSNND